MNPKHSFLLLPAIFLSVPLVAQAIPSAAAIDAKVGDIIAHTAAKGMAVAVIDRKVSYVHAYGIRNAKGDPLNTGKSF